MEDLFNSSKHSDITINEIVVDEQGNRKTTNVLKLHKCILAIHSGYFEALFSFNPQITETDITVKSKGSLKDVLTYLYGGHYTLGDVQNIFDNIVLMDFLQMSKFVYKLDNRCLENNKYFPQLVTMLYKVNLQHYISNSLTRYIKMFTILSSYGDEFYYKQTLFLDKDEEFIKIIIQYIQSIKKISTVDDIDER